MIGFMDKYGFVSELVSTLNETNYPDLMRKTLHSKTSNNPYHREEDVWSHTMMALNYVLEKEPAFPSIRLLIAVLLHDIGKYYVMTEEDDKTYFKGHPGMSVFVAGDVLKLFIEKRLINDDDAIYILNLIASHHAIDSNSFSLLKFMQKYAKYGKDFVNDMINLRFADNNGRISTRRAFNNNMLLGLQNNIVSCFDDYYKNDDVVSKSNKIIFMVGVPGAGKTSFIRNNFNETYEEYKVISRDDIITSMLPELSYDEAFKAVNHDEVNAILQKQVQYYINNRRDIIIDMTNVNKKGWNRFSIPSYYSKQAIVIYTGMHSAFERQLDHNNAKHIPFGVIKDFAVRYNLPTFDYFNTVSFHLNL